MDSKRCLIGDFAEFEPEAKILKAKIIYGERCFYFYFKGKCRYTFVQFWLNYIAFSKWWERLIDH